MGIVAFLVSFGLEVLLIVLDSFTDKGYGYVINFIIIFGLIRALMEVI